MDREKLGDVLGRAAEANAERARDEGSVPELRLAAAETALKCCQAIATLEQRPRRTTSEP